MFKQVKNDLNFKKSQAVEVSKILKELSHPNRLMIICELLKAERTVSELGERLECTQSNLSRDLARLRALGLVKSRRESKHIYYSIADSRLRSLVEALCQVFSPEV